MRNLKVATLVLASIVVGWTAGHGVNIVHAAGMPDISDIELQLSMLRTDVQEIENDIHTLVHKSPAQSLSSSGDYKITEVSSIDLAYGTVKAPGDFKGFPASPMFTATKMTCQAM